MKIDKEPLTKAQWKLVHQALDEIERGEIYPWDEVMREIEADENKL